MIQLVENFNNFVVRVRETVSFKRKIRENLKKYSKIIVIVTGYSNSGKTTFSELFSKVFKFKQYSLGEPLKASVYSLFNLDYKEAEDNRDNIAYLAEKLGFNIDLRTFLISMAEDWFKKLDKNKRFSRYRENILSVLGGKGKNIFTKLLADKIIMEDEKLIIVDDFRDYDNIEFFKYKLKEKLEAFDKKPILFKHVHIISNKEFKIMNENFVENYQTSKRKVAGINSTGKTKLYEDDDAYEKKVEKCRKKSDLVLYNLFEDYDLFRNEAFCISYRKHSKSRSIINFYNRIINDIDRNFF